MMFPYVSYFFSFPTDPLKKFEVSLIQQTLMSCKIFYFIFQKKKKISLKAEKMRRKRE